MTTDTQLRWWVTVTGTAHCPLTDDDRERLILTLSDRAGFSLASDSVSTQRLSMSFTCTAATEQDAKTDGVEIAQMIARAVLGEPLTDLGEVEVEADSDE